MRLTPGLKKAFDPCGIPMDAKTACKKCGFCFPVYVGRYPKSCPHCHSEMEKEEMPGEETPPTTTPSTESPPITPTTPPQSTGGGVVQEDVGYGELAGLVGWLERRKAAKLDGEKYGLLPRLINPKKSCCCQSSVEEAVHAAKDGVSVDMVVRMLVAEGFAPASGACVMDPEESDVILSGATKGEIARRLRVQKDMNAFPEPVFPPRELHPHRFRNSSKRNRK